MNQYAHSISTAHDQRAVTAEPAPTRRAKTSNNPLSRINGNTRRGRRFSDLLRSYLRAMGNPVEANRQADAIAAAELKCAAEDLRARLLAGPNAGLADVEQIIRLENAADRAVRKLRIEPGAAPAGPTLEEHLAKLARERVDDGNVVDDEGDAPAESDEGGDRHDDDDGEEAEA
jgi:hypothetical protein